MGQSLFSAGHGQRTDFATETTGLQSITKAEQTVHADLEVRLITIERETFEPAVDQVLGGLRARRNVVESDDRADVRIASARTVHEVSAFPAAALQFWQRYAPKYRPVELRQRASAVKGSLEVFKQQPSTLQVCVAGDAAKNRAAVSVCAVCDDADQRP